MALIAVAIAACSFLYRFNTLGGPLGGFDNDHFAQLVRATAILDGERPLRDFTDAELRALWPSPTYSTSAVAQRILGRSLRSEALLTIGLLSIGAAGLFLVSARVASAVIPAFIATILAVALRPALYNYPKILLYVLGVGAMLGYARRPTVPRLAMIGLVVGIAALFRHDHGVYLGLASAALLVWMHGRYVLRPLAVVVLTCGLTLLPGIVLAHVDGGLLKYFRESLELSRQEAARTTSSRVRFVVDPSQPLLQHLDAASPPAPRINVRWTASLTPELRRRAEADLRLLDPYPRSEASDWSYALDDTSRTHLGIIVGDPRVRDTDGVDRARFVLTTPPPPPPGWTAELLRWRIAPGIFRSDNALPWLYVVAWVVIFYAAFCALQPLRYNAMAARDIPLPAFRAVCLLSIILLMALLRSPNPSRLADVSVPVTILGSWLVAGIVRSSRWRSLPTRVVIVGALIIVGVISGSAIVVLRDVVHQLEIANLADAARARRQWNTVSAMLGGLPASLQGIDGNLQRASGYLRRCTRPTDRIFLADNLPELFYFADRRFAAGHVSYFSNFYSSLEQQREAVDRWRKQAVPVALTPPAARFGDEFATDYPLLTEYLRSRYHNAGQLAVEQGAVVDVWVEGTQKRPVDRATGLPCVASD
jgi:hypothetical protein